MTFLAEGKAPRADVTVALPEARPARLIFRAIRCVRRAGRYTFRAHASSRLARRRDRARRGLFLGVQGGSEDRDCRRGVVAAQGPARAPFGARGGPRRRRRARVRDARARFARRFAGRRHRRGGRRRGARRHRRRVRGERRRVAGRSVRHDRRACTEDCPPRDDAPGRRREPAPRHAAPPVVRGRRVRRRADVRGRRVRGRGRAARAPRRKFRTRSPTETRASASRSASASTTSAPPSPST